MPNDREELDRVIGALEHDEQISSEARALDTAEQRRRQLCVGLKDLRQSVSQVELARRIGTSQPAIARLEAGFADPKLSTLLRYGAALGYELQFSWQPVRAVVPA